MPFAISVGNWRGLWTDILKTMGFLKEGEKQQKLRHCVVLIVWVGLAFVICANELILVYEIFWTCIFSSYLETGEIVMLKIWFTFKKCDIGDREDVCYRIGKNLTICLPHLVVFPLKMYLVKVTEITMDWGKRDKK